MSEQDRWSAINIGNVRRLDNDAAAMTEAECTRTRQVVVSGIRSFFPWTFPGSLVVLRTGTGTCNKVLVAKKQLASQNQKNYGCD